jgi:hypothetical protein
MKVADKKRFNQLKKLNFHNLALHTLELESYVGELRKGYTEKDGEIKELKAVESRLTYEKEEYEVSLRAEIERIQLLGPWERFWSSVKLFKSLFEVIQKGFKK